MARFPSPKECLPDQLEAQHREAERTRLREREKLNSLGLVHLEGMLVKGFSQLQG